jgi:hypothetical protein
MGNLGSKKEPLDIKMSRNRCLTEFWKIGFKKYTIYSRTEK